MSRANRAELFHENLASTQKRSFELTICSSYSQTKPVLL